MNGEYLTIRGTGDRIELRIDDDPVITLTEEGARWLLEQLERRVEPREQRRSA